MGVDHGAKALVGVADGCQPVGVGALAAGKAVAAGGLGKSRVGTQVKTALAGELVVKQRACLAAVAAQQVEHKALEIRRLGNVHRRAGSLVRVGAAAHTVHAGAEELVEHVVFVRGDDQFVNRQAHAARDMTGADVAKIARRHGEADFFSVGFRRLEIAREVINHLRHQPRPVDRVDSADLVLPLELQIVRDGLDDVLAVVKHADDGDVVDVLVLQAEHLRLLERAHAPVRRGHKNAHAFFAAHGVFGGAAGVAAGRAQNIQLFATPGQFVLEQVAEQLHRHVFERQRRAVGQGF